VTGLSLLVDIIPQAGHAAAGALAVVRA